MRKYGMFEDMYKEIEEVRRKERYIRKVYIPISPIG